jgi:cell cycle checkpoint protein
MTAYIQKSQIPTILIFSDVYEGRCKPEVLERFIDPALLSSPNMTKIIQINPVTKPKMKSCLLRIVKGEGKHGLTRMLSTRGGSSCSNGDIMEELHTQSGGDLRHAIMTLQFQFVGDEEYTHNQRSHSSSSRDKRLLETKHQSKEPKKSQRDVRLSTFHTLGKLLYAKRINNLTCNIDTRPSLEFEPEMVLENSTIGLNGAINFLGYHSPDFFTDITELSYAFGRFSDAAYLLDNSYVSFAMESNVF